MTYTKANNGVGNPTDIQWRCLVLVPRLSTPYVRIQRVLKVSKANIKVMVGFFLPPNELKLISLSSSGIRSHSLSPPANLMVGQSHMFYSAAGDGAGLAACNRVGTGAQRRGQSVFWFC